MQTIQCPMGDVCVSKACNHRGPHTFRDPEGWDHEKEDPCSTPCRLYGVKGCVKTPIPERQVLLVTKIEKEVNP